MTGRRPASAIASHQLQVAGPSARQESLGEADGGWSVACHPLIGPSGEGWEGSASCFAGVCVHVPGCRGGQDFCVSVWGHSAPDAPEELLFPKFRLIPWLASMVLRASPLCLVMPSNSPLCLVYLSPWVRTASCLLLLHPRGPPPVSRPRLCFGPFLKPLTNGHYGEVRVVLASYCVLIDRKESGTLV